MKRKKKTIADTSHFGVADFLIGDSHIGYIPKVGAYPFSAFRDLTMIFGGDLIHGEQHKTIELGKADYAVIEERIVNHMAKEAVDNQQKVAVEPKVKPTRTPKKRDWEQRTRKGRR